MAAAITSVTFDKPLYHPGDTITATVTYTGTLGVLNISGTMFDGSVISGSGSFTVLPNEWTASDGTSRLWTLVSDNGSTAVFTATA